MKSFKTKIFFILNYFFFWIIYFVFARTFFLIYYLNKTQELDLITILNTFTYGIQLDFSFTGYICIIPFLINTLSFLIRPSKIFKFIKWYTFIVLIILSLLLFVDAGLYQSWGVRIDSSLLPYLNKPSLMIASASTFQLLSGIIGWVLVSLLFIKLYKVFIDKKVKNTTYRSWIEIPVFLILTAVLIIPVRGGFQTIPVNQSNVYFSNKMFANHASLNFSWNFFNTLKRVNDGTNPYKYFEDKIAISIINKTKNNLLKSNTDSILNTTKPNFILILWESLSAKVVGSLGGEPTVTPNLNRLSKEGILFTNFYSNGDRTDKAIPSILSGYYPPPVERIMRMPNKTRSLPMLPKKLKEIGYNTSFYYGGDLNFGNMNTYLRNAEIEEIVDGSEFDKKDWNSKWGAYDDVFMKRFAKDLEKPSKKPFFKIALTLTSHEPYEIKGKYLFGKDTEDNKYRSAHYYTDKVIGDFIAHAKKQDWYKETVIIIMADHGHSSPKHEGPYFSDKKFQIPMLWLGGAINKNIKEINTVSSQVDFSYSILDLLNADNSSFTFSKNIFNNSDKQYAHYIFNKGFGIISKDGMFVYDYISKKPILKKGENTKELDSLGKAITQNAYQDFLDR